MAVLWGGPLTAAFAGRERDPADVREAVVAWRRDLGAAVSALPALEWSEDGASRRLDVEAGAEGLRLLALYAEHPELEWPDELPSAPGGDRAWRRASEAGFPGSRFGQILAPGLWLPADFAFTVRFPGPDGVEREIGSLPVLTDQLRLLDRAVMLGGGEGSVAWLDLPAPPGGPFLDAARRGWAAFSELAGECRRRSVPLLCAP